MLQTEPQAPVGWRARDWWYGGFRLSLLLVLVAGMTSAILAMNPPMRPTEELTADVRAGRVTYLEYNFESNEIRWATGWWRWRTTIADPTWATNDPATGNRNPDDRALQWLRGQVAASGHPVTVQMSVGNNSRWWPVQIVWQPLQVLAMIAWLGTFGLMLLTSAHRYANRWAWFWLFTIGQVGALLYVVLEPRPIWKPSSAAVPPGRTPAGGGTGCLWSFLLSIAVPMLMLGVVWALSA
jgi:hypothetical protein